MLRCVRIIVSARFRETLTAAASSLVDMECKEAAFALLRKAGEISHYHNTAAFLIKPYLSRQTRCLGSPVDIGHRVRADRVTIHTITSRQLMQKKGVW